MSCPPTEVHDRVTESGTPARTVSRRAVAYSSPADWTAVTGVREEEGVAFCPAPLSPFDSVGPIAELEMAWGCPSTKVPRYRFSR